MQGGGEEGEGVGEGVKGEGLLLGVGEGMGVVLPLDPALGVTLGVGLGLAGHQRMRSVQVMESTMPQPPLKFPLRATTPLGVARVAKEGTHPSRYTPPTPDCAVNPVPTTVAVAPP